MAGDAESNQGKGGLFASIGRLLGRKGRKEDEDREPDAGWAERAGAPDRHAPADTRTEGAGPAADTRATAVMEDEEDELVLGPAFKASPPAEEGSDDKLTLTGGSAVGGANGVGAQGEAEEPAGEPESGPTEEPEADVILERLRAIRGEQEEDEASTDERLTTSEQEWVASFGAAVQANEEPEGDESPDQPSHWPSEREGERSEPSGLSEVDDPERAQAEAVEDDEGTASDEAVPPFPGMGPAHGDAAMERRTEGAEPESSEEADMATERDRETEDWTAEEETGPDESPAAEARAEEGEPKVPAGEEESEAEEADSPGGESPETTSEAAEEPRPESPEAEVSTAEAPAVAAPETEPTGPDTEGDDESDGDETKMAAEGEERAEVPAEEDVAASTDVPPEDETEAGTDEEKTPGEEGPETTELAAVLAATGRASASPETSAEAGRPDEETTEAAPSESTGMGEAAVEEIVRRVVREEMEGELGERLSANIRRMIRDEVARAMIRHR